jgi:hypothetical protein
VYIGLQATTNSIVLRVTGFRRRIRHILQDLFSPKTEHVRQTWGECNYKYIYSNSATLLISRFYVCLGVYHHSDVCADGHKIENKQRFLFEYVGLVVRDPGYRSRVSGFDSRRYQIFWDVVGLERCSLSLVSTIDALRGRNSSGSGLENREYGRGDLLNWPRGTLYPQMSALTSPTCGGPSVGIVRLRTKATECL